MLRYKHTYLYTYTFAFALHTHAHTGTALVLGRKLILSLLSAAFLCCFPAISPHSINFNQLFAVFNKENKSVLLSLCMHVCANIYFTPVVAIVTLVVDMVEMLLMEYLPFI